MILKGQLESVAKKLLITSAQDHSL